MREKRYENGNKDKQLHIDVEWFADLLTERRNRVNLKHFQSELNIEIADTLDNREIFEKLSFSNSLKFQAITVEQKLMPNITIQKNFNLKEGNINNLVTGNLNTVEGFVLYNESHGVKVISKADFFSKGQLSRYKRDNSGSSEVFVSLLSKSSESIYGVTPFSKVTLTYGK